MLTVTGATISNSVVISGLTFTGGDVSGGFGCPNYCGGGLLIINDAQLMNPIQLGARHVFADSLPPLVA